MVGSGNKNSIKMAEDVTGIGNRHYLMGGGGKSGGFIITKIFLFLDQGSFSNKADRKPKEEDKGMQSEGFLCIPQY